MVNGGKIDIYPCGSSSVGRASASQAEGHEFEPRLPLKAEKQKISYFNLLFLFFIIARKEDPGFPNLMPKKARARHLF